MGNLLLGSQNFLVFAGKIYNNICRQGALLHLTQQHFINDHQTHIENLVKHNVFFTISILTGLF